MSRKCCAEKCHIIQECIFILPADTSIAILAGGQSQRFGSPKALARLGDRPLLHYALALAGRLSSEIAVSSANTSLQDLHSYRQIEDSIPDCGPLGGIYTMLCTASTDWVGFIPCDMPLLHSDIYLTLSKLRKAEKPVATISSFGLEPLVSIWPRSIASTVKIIIDQHKLALHQAFKTLGGVGIDLSEVLSNYDSAWFTNINYVQDLATLDSSSRSS